MLLAGGQGSRLYALTSHMAKPAVPFGGKYRIIDFALSNCTNSGIDTVGVLTQYRPLELNAYLGSGQPWDLDKGEGGVHILPPYVARGDAGRWYKGTADAVLQNLDFLELYDPEDVLVLSGDHIYKMDYAALLAFHRERGAAATLSAVEVDPGEAGRFGILETDGADIVRGFEEKPREPKGTLASMGVYAFRWAALKKYLLEDGADPASRGDFGGDVIPRMLAAGERLTVYRFQGYWKDVGTISALWEANMDLLSIHSGIHVYDPAWPVYTRCPILPPHVTGEGAELSHSIVTGGAEIFGRVENSVLSHSVVVEPGARVSYSVLMPGAVVRAGARVEYAILAEGADIGPGAHVGGEPGSACQAIAVVGGGAAVPAGGRVRPGGMYTQGEKGEMSL